MPFEKTDELQSCNHQSRHFREIILHNPWFWLLQVAVALTFFFINNHHQVQQGIFWGTYVPQAELLASGDGFVNPDAPNEPALYPMWGYSAILSLLILAHIPPAVGILLLQFVLAMTGLLIFYSVVKHPPRFWHMLMFVPWYALMSTRWPEAIIGFLLLLAVVLLPKQPPLARMMWIVPTGLCFGLCYHLRSEWILFPAIFLMIYLLGSGEGGKVVLRTAGTVLVIAAFTASPWFIRSWIVSGSPVVGSTNAGAVMYTALGQLSNNPWGIHHSDSTAYAVAREHGIDDPWSIEGNKLFWRLVSSAFRENPGAFALKCGQNFGRALVNGLYIGELPMAASTSQRFEEARRLFASFQIAEAWRQLNSSEKMTWILQLGLQAVFRGLLIVLILAAVTIFVREGSRRDLLDWFLISIVIFKLIMVSVVQYESRHLNTMYLPLLAFVLRSVRVDNFRSAFEIFLPGRFRKNL